MCTLKQELFYTAPLLEKAVVTLLPLKDLTTLTTTSHWKWLASSGIRKTRWYYSFWCKESSPWAFPSDQRLYRLSSPPYFMRNKISESRFSCVPHLSIHDFTKMHPANTGMPIICAHKHISFPLAQAGYLQLPFLCTGQCMENLTLWKASPSD